MALLLARLTIDNALQGPALQGLAGQCQNSHEKTNQLISDHVDSDLATVQFCMM